MPKSERARTRGRREETRGFFAEESDFFPLFPYNIAFVIFGVRESLSVCV